MKNLPLVTVICACYNQSQYVIESLESVKNQTYSNFEVLIWDDCSSDNSVEIIEAWVASNSHLPIKFVKHEVNKGICKSLNDCFLLANGQYIQTLALDDIILPDKLERHVYLLEKAGAKNALIFSDAYIIDEKSEIVKDTSFIERNHGINNICGNSNYYEKLLNSNFIPAMSVLMKREAIFRVGLWDEGLAFEDYDMWLRLSKEFDFLYDNSLTVKYRIHSTNSHKNSFAMEIGMFDMYLKYDHKIAQARAMEVLKNIYLSGKMTDQNRRYFAKYKVNNLFDFFIKANMPIFISSFFIRIKLIINKFSNRYNYL